MDIAQTIRTARKKAQLTQRQLASKMQVTPSAVAQWETGETTPTIGNRADLSQKLNIPFIHLLPEIGEGAPVTVQDPLTLAIVRQVLKLPRKVREAFLMQIAATVETMEARKGPGQPEQ